MVSAYEREKERLSKLPRAQRFEELMDFPVAHTFKVIGRTLGFSEAVVQALDAAGHPEVCLMERSSTNGRYLSLTFTVEVRSGEELDGLYSCLEQVPGLAYLL